MRRIALISDIHGNLAALEATLDDIARRGVGERYCLGDLVGYGPDPAGVVELVRRLGIPTIQGNYDRGIGGRIGNCGCHYATDQARRDGAASYEFTVREVDDTDASWLTALPTEIRLEHQGVRILLTHGSPRRINEYLLLDRPARMLVGLADEAGADVVCVGHVHVPYHRSLAADRGRRIHYVSAGSVGKPKDGDPRACWVELLLGTEEEVRLAAVRDDNVGAAGGSGSLWVAVVAHRVTYDVASVAEAMRVAGLPPTLAAALESA